MATLCFLVRGFVRFGSFEIERISERTRGFLPNGPDLFRDRDEGCTDKDNERGWKDASPQLPGKWIPEVEEVGTHA